MSQTLSLLPVDVTLRFPRALAALLSLHFQDTAGADINITGDTITMICRDTYGGTQKFTQAATLSDPTHGLAQLPLTALQLTDTQTMGVSRWVYVITRTQAGGDPVAWWGGTLEICETAK